MSDQSLKEEQQPAVKDEEPNDTDPEILQTNSDKEVEEATDEVSPTNEDDSQLDEVSPVNEENWESDEIEDLQVKASHLRIDKVPSQRSKDLLQQAASAILFGFHKLLPSEKTTAQKLIKVLNETRRRRLSSVFDDELDLGPQNSRRKTNIDLDEVYPRVCLGNGLTATNLEFLISKEVTHVLNAADGRRFNDVKTGADFYDESSITYLGFNLGDNVATNISRYFNSAAHFIDEAVESGGRVFVHCRAGISRSVTLVVAYLMIKKNMTAADALQRIKLVRDRIGPNIGFLQQLAELDNQLRERRPIV